MYIMYILRHQNRNTMTQSRLNHLAILSIESETLEMINFNKVIEDFVSKKSK